MVNINIDARLEAISEIANLVNADFKLRDGKIIEWSKGNKPTEEEIQSKIDSKKYQRNRAVSYPAIGDQLDMLFHAIDAGKVDKTSDFYKSLKAVKDKYPKG